MFGQHRIGSVVLALVALSGTVVPQTPTDDPDGLERRVQQIRKLMTTGKWKAALARVERTLTQHEGQPSARLRAAELIELHKRCSFRMSVGDPEPTTLISGDLLSWNPSTGQIKLRYTPDTMKDFEKGERSTIHPMRMAGPHTVSIRGDSYPSILGKKGSPTILVCSDSKNGFYCMFGFGQATDGAMDRWMPARMVDVSKDGPSAVVDEKETTLAKTGRPFLLKVKVAKTSVRASYNNRSLLKGKKPKEHFGYVGIADIGSFTELIIEGTAEPAWLQGLIDKSLDDKRREFDKTYDPRAKLPAWLFETATKKASGAAPTTSNNNYPNRFTERQQYFIGRVERLLRREKYSKTVEFIERQDEARIPQPTRSYLLALCLVELEQYDAALPHAKRIAEQKAFLPGQLLLADSLEGAGQRAPALALYERLGAEHPRNVEVQFSLAQMLMLSGRFADAKKASVRAMSFASAQEKKVVESMHRSIAKAVDGPSWSRTYESKSRHYHVYSDIDRKTCVEAAKTLEAAYRCYNVHLEAAARTTERFRVYLFSGEAGYLAYTKDLFGDAQQHTAGLYSDYVKQLLIWNLSNRDAMMRTVRHEGFHQYLARVLPNSPSWFDEGHAEYYETAEYSNGRWRTGKVREDHLETLRTARTRPLPLEDFLFMGYTKFYAKPDRNYAQAWALVHFLRHGDSEYRPLVDKLFTQLQAQVPLRKTLRSVFPKAMLPKLQQKFTDYVKELTAGG